MCSGQMVEGGKTVRRQQEMDIHALYSNQYVNLTSYLQVKDTYTSYRRVRGFVSGDE
jgi:hypothetical protein